MHAQMPLLGVRVSPVLSCSWVTTSLPVLPVCLSLLCACLALLAILVDFPSLGSACKPSPKVTAKCSSGTFSRRGNEAHKPIVVDIIRFSCTSDNNDPLLLLYPRYYDPGARSTYDTHHSLGIEEEPPLLSPSPLKPATCDTNYFRS